MDVPIGQVTKCEKWIERGLGGSQRFPRGKSPCEEWCTCPRHKNKPIYVYNVRWTSKFILLSLITAVNNNVYQQ
jgi:hypothetical protein